MRFSNGSPDIVAEECRADPVLRRWLAEPWIDPRALRAQAMVRPFARYVVADDFLRPEQVSALRAAVSGLSYQLDYPDLHYHAEAVRLDAPSNDQGVELFLHPLWHAWVACVLNVTLTDPGRTVIRARRHPRCSRGFWIHTDRDPIHAKAAAALIYLTPDWRLHDGGLLQLWEAESMMSGTPIYWADYHDRALDFLHHARELDIEVATIDGFSPMRVRLLDRIVPAENRLVLLDFQAGPTYHSITPTRDRVREGIVQWLY